MMDSFIGNEQLFVDWCKGKDQLMIPEKAWYFFFFFLFGFTARQEYFSHFELSNL